MNPKAAGALRPTAERHAGQTESRAAIVLVGVALIAAMVVYSPSIRGEFQFDDEPNIERNKALKHIEQFGNLEAWSLAARPLTTLTLALNHRAGHLDPFGYHLTNVAIHLAAVVLVFILSRRTLHSAALAPAGRYAAAVAGLFALHPIQTEAVSYVIQRSEALASLLYIGALLFMLETETARSRLHAALFYAGALVAAIAALATKPIAATLPLAYLFHVTIFPPARAKAPWNVWQRLALCAPLFAFSAIASWQVLSATAGSMDAGFDVPGLDVDDYVLTQFRVVFRYLGLLVWPVGQNVAPDVPVSRSFFEPATFVAALGLGGIALASILALFARPSASWGWRSVARIAAFGFVWFLLLLLPSSLVPLADVMAEHRVYLASWGVFLAFVAVAETAVRAAKLPPAVRAPTLIALWVALGTITWIRNGVWETRVALWSDAAAKSPRSVRPHAALAWAYARKDDHARALPEYQKALDLHPNRHHAAEILNSMGFSLAQLGRHGDATVVLAAAAADPAVEVEARTLRALSLLHLGLPGAGRAEVMRALERDPERGAARNALGRILLAQDEVVAALEQFRIAVRLDPDVAPWRLNVFLALDRLGPSDERCVAWREYLETEKGPAAIARPHSDFQVGCDSP